jgi:HEAT repeat protein
MFTKLSTNSRNHILILVAAMLVLPVGRRVSAQTTDNLTPIRKAIEVQRARLNSSSEEERRDALMKLGAMHSAEASRAALPGLSDPGLKVRAVAVGAILSIPAEEGVDALTPLMNDKDEFVRRETAYALGHTKSRKATAVLTTHLLTDKEDGVRAAAAVALGEIADESAIVALSSTLAPTLTSGKSKQQEKNPFVLRAAAVALGATKSRAATPALISALTNAKLDSDVRREAARALGVIGDPAAVSALQSALTADDPYLANIANASLKKISH